MTLWLRAQLRRGILGEGRRAAVASLVLLGAWYGTNLVYGLLNHGPNRIFLRTPLDDAIPLVRIFVIPYVSLVPFIGASMLIFLLVRGRIFRSAAMAMIAAWLVSYSLYLFLQSYVDRPALSGDDFLTTTIRRVYAADRPYNDFPSLHTSLSAILAIHWWRVDRRIGIPVAIWTGLIVLSTLLVKQHYIADLVSGLVLAALTSALALRWSGAGGLGRSPGRGTAAVAPAG